ncbi:uncharacterized protein LOC108631080 [Ceratina calcarata]|uniref:Uncharacterized protein LOC108631080 n=1 Tax=Ceratina calcarata TaxID=156304 RepID=A0AAJ7NDS8_9HYME|nr:uncharacterized protein LOC108631080 [Ceratina calcarata]
MSKGTKFFVKPKVRFCQNDNSELTKAPEDTNISKDVKQMIKPKILSNVKFDKDIRLIKLNESPTNRASNDSKMINNAMKTNSSAVSSKMIRTSQSLNKDCIEIESHTPLNDANNIQNIKANCKNIYTPKADSSISDTDISLVEQNRKIKKSIRPAIDNSNLPRTDSTKDEESKENKTGAIKKSIKGSTKRSSDSEILKHKARLSSVNTTKKNSNLSNKTPVSVKTKKHTISKSKVVDVMPCYKYSKSPKKVKTPAVKKTVIRNIIGPKIQAYIGPGVVHKKESDIKFSETAENVNVKPIISGDKLARPEYNSIMCTINKLNEVKKQRIVPDVDHLLPVYKNLINEKVSSALDFPLDEAVYKNLVDLSIDENQLPSRLTRSKDPEPRQRDIVPMLSDFFTPVPTEEYRTAVFAKPRITETANNWNAFRISDQISEWKHILEHT